MKIAILGTRGIPNHYGGFEQYAELFATFLAQQGWDVTVYNSSDHPFQDSDYKGVHIRHISDPEKKMGTIGQFFYDLGCILDSRKQNFDVIYQLGYTSSAVFNFLLPKHTVIVTNMDGLEWKRSKYNKWVKRFLLFSEKIVVRKSDHLVADSIGIQSYLKEKYNVLAYYSAYTAAIPSLFDDACIKQYDLVAKQYDLVVARLEPENNIEMIIDAHLPDNVPTTLVVIGNANTKYGRYLQQKYPTTKVKFIGAVYDKIALDSIRHYSALYFHGHSVGGTNPSLLEAMACGCSIVAHDNIFNRSILQQDAFYFASADELNKIIANTSALADFYPKAVAANLERITNIYSETHVFVGMKQQLDAWRKSR